MMAMTSIMVMGMRTIRMTTTKVIMTTMTMGMVIMTTTEGILAREHKHLEKLANIFFSEYSVAAAAAATAIIPIPITTVLPTHKMAATTIPVIRMITMVTSTMIKETAKAMAGEDVAGTLRRNPRLSVTLP
jgi:hypothetical protein